MRPHRSLILVAALISSAQAFTVATAPIAGPGAKPLKTCLGSLGHRRSVVSQAAKLGLCVALALGSPPNAEAKIASNPQTSMHATSRTTMSRSDSTSSAASPSCEVFSEPGAATCASESEL